MFKFQAALFCFGIWCCLFCLTFGTSYYNKCYCPGVDPLLNTEKNLRNKMYALKTAATNGLNVSYARIIPATGVPPVNVLQIMFPNLDNSTFQTMTFAQYNASFMAVQAAIQQRTLNLQNSALARNDVMAPLRISSGTNNMLGFFMPTNTSANMTLSLDNYAALLQPENIVYGIQPTDGTLQNAQNCQCFPPSFKCRKQLKYNVFYIPGMENPTDPNFQRMKSEIETLCDSIFSGNNALLTNQGFAGSVVLGMKLSGLGVVAPPTTTTPAGKRRKRQAATSTDTTTTTITTTGSTVSSNTTASGITTTTSTTTTSTTTTPPPRLDAILADLEVTMAGSDTPANMIKSIDTVLKGNPLIMQASTCLASVCTTDTLSSLNVPSALMLTPPTSTAIPSGFYVTYTCSQPNQMIPFTSDLDSNFALEVYCYNGVFQTPVWPTSCETLRVCTAVPTPPTNVQIPLYRVDNRTKFRVGESAYFACSNPNSVLDDGSGLSVFTLPCPATLVYNVTWPNCFLEPVCDTYHVPSPDSGLQLATSTSSVLLGNQVNYECIRRSEFYETTNGPTYQILCDNPVNNNKGSMVAPSPWPTCSKLPCVCLGYGPDANTSLNILQTSCPSNMTYNSSMDANNVTFILPRIVNCGSYHPTYPTFNDMCECPELGTPVTFWNVMQIITFTWNDKMSDASQQFFQKQKQKAEISLDAFYMNQSWVLASGYIRTIVVYFKMGNPQPTNPDLNYVKATVVHLFRSDTNMTLDAFTTLHANMLTQNHGIFSPTFSIYSSTSISANINCANNTMSRFYTAKYNVTGVKTPVSIGNNVTVQCGKPIQFFTLDIWDGNSTDNILTITCKPDSTFNVPPPAILVDCLAKCPALKPQPPNSSNLILDTQVTSPTVELWENMILGYKCNHSLDGIAVKGPTGAMEGSNVRTQTYICDSNGNYAIPVVNGAQSFPNCLPRPRRCQCLGSYTNTNFSLVALDLYCRNQTFKILPSTVQDSNNGFIPQIVPNKTRCGSLDPVEMNLVENRCYCLTKDNEGSQAAFWTKLEIFNIPWTTDLLNFTSSNFTAAKYIVERALDIAYINSPNEFGSGYVRSLVMRFAKGSSILNGNWTYLMKLAQNMTNGTITSLDDISANYSLTNGYPILPQFDPFPVAGPKRGVSSVNFYSTIAFIELQFATLAMDAASLTLDTQYLVMPNNWVSNTLWVNTNCFSTPANQPLCGFSTAPLCQTVALTVVNGFGMSNDATTQGKTFVMVGSTVNIFCSDKQKRVTVDKSDDNPYDYLLTVLCSPSGGFSLPLDANNKMPPCKAWCNGTKPVPSPDSGLKISVTDNNTREYWEDDQLTYICKNDTLGVEAADTAFQNFTCIYDATYGNRFTTPLDILNQTWPLCMERTTTVQPPLKIGFQNVLKQFEADLVKTNSLLQYNLQQTSGDKNYLVIVTVPTLIFLAIIILACLCCTRYDNSLWSHCSGPSDAKS